MDVAKVARDYFVSSQSSLLIPNRSYGTRKMINVGYGRSHSTSDIVKNNSNSNLHSRRHSSETKHQELDDDSFAAASRRRKFTLGPKSKMKKSHSVDIPEEAENNVREYPWRTTSGSNLDDEDLNSDTFSNNSSNSSNFAASETSQNISDIPQVPNIDRSISRVNTNVLSLTSEGSSDKKPLSEECFPDRPPDLVVSPVTSFSPSSLSLSTRPRPSSGNVSNGGGRSNVTGLFGAGSSKYQGARQKALAMKSVSAEESQPSDDDFVDKTDFRESSSKTWQHPPDQLLNGHILYTVKFLGECAVERTKGTDTVKEAIRKMKFNKHIKRAEGQKPPKVDLVISAEAVCILDKNRTLLHRYPLHLISYCADDKADKRMVTFIAKEQSSTQHHCYVFDSEKCAEEITLTIGQAFDLAYKKFLESHSNEGDLRKQYIALQKKVQTLASENMILKNRISDLEKLKDRSDIDEYKKVNQISDLSISRKSSNDNNSSETKTTPRATVVGRRLENLMPINDSPVSTNGSERRGSNGAIHSVTTNNSGTMPILSPPPANTRSHRTNSGRGHTLPGDDYTHVPDPFGSSPAVSPAEHVDPFGMQAFNPISVSSGTHNGSTEQELMDIRNAFSRGLTFGTEDFSLDDFDPLNQR